MFWYGDGMSGWGYGLMTVGMVLFWGLIIFGFIALVRYTSGPSARDNTAALHGLSAQQVLAARFARGEIDEEEYARRLKILDSGVPPIATV